MTTVSSYQEPEAHGAERRPTDALADDVIRVMAPDGTLSDDLGIDDDTAVLLYRTMVRTRIIDDRAVALQRQGRIGFHIGSLGEEASIIGSAFALRDDDWIFPCYREFGAALMRGFPLQRYFDNLYGNANDLSQGRQMPDHWCSREHRVASVNSPIGTQITHAVGLAWAARLRKDPIAVLVYFGDGATSSSEFHNGLNFAGVYATPTVFLCRNNGWAISVPTDKQTASETFAAKGIAYGVPAVRVDGNDIFAVVKATREAVDRAARGDGPTLIEALTYRLSGHSTSDDPTRYRPEGEVEQWEQLDPLLRMRRHLAQRVAWGDAEEAEIEKTTTHEIKAVIEIAENTPKPSLESMFEGVYADLPWHLREQYAELKAGLRAQGHGG
jgi:2-oxoisovalerate dehydrogenase E1 component alpha subunit